MGRNRKRHYAPVQEHLVRITNDDIHVMIDDFASLMDMTYQEASELFLEVCLKTRHARNYLMDC